MGYPRPLGAAAGAILILASVAASTACARREVVQAASAEPPQRVTAVRAELRDLSRAAEITAEFRPFQEVDVHAKVAGYLKQILVDVGDHVRAGQVIGILEVPEYREELQQASATEKRSQLDVTRAQSEVKRAESALQIAKVTWERLDSVSRARPHLIAQQEIDTAHARYQEAEAALATAKANAASVQQQVEVSAAGRSRVSTMLSYLRVTAPFNGVVTKRYADTGAMIQAGTASQSQAMPLVRISQVDTLRLTLPVPESIVSRVRLGGPVEVRVDSLQRVFEGRISRFAGRLDQATRTMSTEVDIRNPDGTLMPGMYGYASLILERRADTLAVPVQAVARSGAKATVLLLDGQGRLHLREVETRMETPAFVEIAGGLSPGDLVVVGNRALLDLNRPTTANIRAASEMEASH